MTGLRQRKGSKVKDPGLNPQNQRGNASAEIPGTPTPAPGVPSCWSVLCVVTGFTVGVGLGLLCCFYMATLHENDLWFSNIKEMVVGNRLSWRRQGMQLGVTSEDEGEPGRYVRGRGRARTLRHIQSNTSPHASVLSHHAGI